MNNEKEYQSHEKEKGLEQRSQVYRGAKEKLKTWQPGRLVSDKTKAKISAALKDREFSEEWRRNLREGWKKRKEKGLSCTEATRAKMRNSHKNPGSTTKGKHWFTNGVVNTLAFDCPEGYWKGKHKKEL